MIQLHKLTKAHYKTESNVFCTYKTIVELWWEEATADSTHSELADWKMCDKAVNTHF